MSEQDNSPSVLIIGFGILILFFVGMALYSVIGEASMVCPSKIPAGMTLDRGYGSGNRLGIVTCVFESPSHEPYNQVKKKFVLSKNHGWIEE